MAYKFTNSKGQDYFLHKTEVTLRGSGKLQTIYYFTRKEGPKGIDEVPSGFSVMEIERTGLPVLKKS